MCEICDKEFFQEWRFKRHMNLHYSSVKRFCHFYNNQKKCPYEELGCKFAHQISPDCKFRENCKNRLCQFTHNFKESRSESEVVPIDDSLEVDKICDDVLKRAWNEFSEEENEILSDSFLDDIMSKVAGVD